MPTTIEKHEKALKKESKMLSGLLKDIEVVDFHNIRKYMISILYCMQWLEYNYKKKGGK